MVHASALVNLQRFIHITTQDCDGCCFLEIWWGSGASFTPCISCIRSLASLSGIGVICKELVHSSWMHRKQIDCETGVKNSSQHPLRCITLSTSCVGRPYSCRGTGDLFKCCVFCLNHDKHIILEDTGYLVGYIFDKGSHFFFIPQPSLIWLQSEFSALQEYFSIFHLKSDI